MKLALTKETVPIKRHSDVLLVTGDGKLLKEDLHEFFQWHILHDTMCIGRSIGAYPGQIQHYADIDADECKWVLENLHETYPGKFNGNLYKHTLGHVDWCNTGWDLMDNPWPKDDYITWHGSTALFAMLIGLEMGYKRIVLAGCPIDSKGHWMFPDEDYGPQWAGETYQAWFEFMKTAQKGMVRSLSGYTKILLSQPDKDFFDGFSKGTASY